MTASTSRRHAEPRTREPRYTTMRDSTRGGSAATEVLEAMEVPMTDIGSPN